MEQMSKETIIYKFSAGEMDILPADCFPNFLTIVNSMATNKVRDMERTKVQGLPLKRMAMLSSQIEEFVKADQWGKASLKLRELYNILNF